MIDPKPPEPTASLDTEYYLAKAETVLKRGYRRMFGRNALNRLERAYHADITALCGRAASLAKLEELEEPEGKGVRR